MFLVFKGFFDHVEADGAEQDERDPVVIGVDHIGKETAQTVTDSRHQGLEDAEPQAGQDHMAPADFTE